MTTQQRDAKGHFLPTPGGPTAKMRALEAEVKALTQERNNWLADFNKCADSLCDAEITIERQASMIARHAVEEPRSAIVGIIIAAVVALFVGVVMGRFVR